MAERTPIKITPHVDDLYQKWFLEYASYVNLDRAIPYIYDGLKPVQRRILHAMKEQDDGRFTKVANLIGQTMQYHPHGDASIGDALVKMGQKELMIETQGNWGDVRTGDTAAAPRYIEARLSQFALHTSFHDANTEWQLSYDGRKREPVFLPIKFPLLLAHGAEGIGVGIRSYIFPHNFIELCEASINIIKGKSFELYPDYITGGLIDVTNYNNGLQGGKVKCRAKIEKEDAKTIKITSVPFSETTGSLIDSILAENEKGRIKIKKVIDNTSSNVEIIIELAAGISPEITIDALYAFTKCEITLSPLGCCVIEDKPVFLGVDEMLRISTKNTVELLKRELIIKKNDLEDKWHYLSLEKIFFEQQIYKELEKKHESWDIVLLCIEKAFIPFLNELHRDVTREDYEKLTEKPVRRIYKLDIEELNLKIKKLEDDIAIIVTNLDHLDQYAIDYFKNLIAKFGKGRERKTDIKQFEQVALKSVAVNNQKLYANFKEGFIGSGIKKEEFICDCTDIDDIIVIRKDGKMIISRLSDKKFVGKDILHVAIFRKDDDRMTYNLIYSDVKGNKNYVKRFQVLGITRDKEYDIAKGEHCKVLYLSANANGEAEIVTIKLTSGCKARVKVFDFDFSSVLVKGRNSQGNIISPYPIQNVTLKKKGISTLGGVHLWINPNTGRPNKNNDGNYLGEFFGDNEILQIHANGSYSITKHENLIKIDVESTILYQKFDESKPISCVYFDGNAKNYFVKRFLIENKLEGKEHLFISEHKDSKLIYASTADMPIIEFEIIKGKDKTKILINENLAEFIDIKGWKALGNRLTPFLYNHNLKDLTPFTFPEFGMNFPKPIFFSDLKSEDNNSGDIQVIQGKLF